MRKFTLWMLIIAMTMLSLLSGCSQTNSQSAEENTDTGQPEKMVVYLSGPASVFQTDEGNFTMYPSAYSFGMNFMDGDLEARQGNIFYEALMQYGEEKGITMEIHFLADLYSGEEPLDDLLQNAYENGTMPDLVLVGKHTELDYYRLREQGILQDWSAFVEADEELQDEAYYMNVLKGGEIDGQQVVMPILFNLNGMITTESWLDKVGVSLSPSDVSYEEILHILKESCMETAEDTQKEALFEYSGRMLAGYYFPSILLSAAHPSYINDTNDAFQISPAVLEGIMEVMEAFQKQEFTPVPNWENQEYQKNVSAAGNKSRKMYE